MPSRNRASAHALTATVLVVLLTAGAGAQTSSYRPTPHRARLGRPRPAGQLHQSLGGGDALRAARPVRGTNAEDIKGEELAEIRRGIQERTRTEQLAGDIGGTRWIWLDSHDHAKGSMAWFVVDPPDGRIPPLTAEARARRAARAEARKKSGRGPADSYKDRSLYDRCISRGLPGSMMPAIYGNSYQIVQAPGYVAIRYEMIHETRVIPLDAVLACRRRSALTWATRGAAGRATPSSSRPPISATTSPIAARMAPR